MSLLDALGLITHRPAALIGIPAGTLDPGAPADLALFDPAEAWEVREDHFHSKSRNSPYIGQKLFGRVKHAVVDGEVVTNRLKKGA
jgi:dihydroorotase